MASMKSAEVASKVRRAAGMAEHRAMCARQAYQLPTEGATEDEMDAALLAAGVANLRRLRWALASHALHGDLTDCRRVLEMAFEAEAALGSKGEEVRGV